MSQILYWCEHTGRSYWEYVEQCEGPEIWDFLAEVWETMKAAIHRGLDAEGVLPGPLNLRRKASAYYIRSKGYKDSLRSRGLVFAYALAVSEENASGGKSSQHPLVEPAEWFRLSCITCRKPRLQRRTYLAGISDRRAGGKHRQAQCFYFGS